MSFEGCFSNSQIIDLSLQAKKDLKRVKKVKVRDKMKYARKILNQILVWAGCKGASPL